MRCIKTSLHCRPTIRDTLMICLRVLDLYWCYNFRDSPLALFCPRYETSLANGKFCYHGA